MEHTGEPGRTSSVWRQVDQTQDAVFNHFRSQVHSHTRSQSVDELNDQVWMLGASIDCSFPHFCVCEWKAMVTCWILGSPGCSVVEAVMHHG